ncbi:MAG: RNA polymerase sigma factor [Pirellulales bacterium]
MVVPDQQNSSKLNDKTDEQLAAESQRDRSGGAAFNCLLERYRQKVWRICFRLMGNEQDAHDAAQEVFVRLFLNRAKFEGRSKYSTWLHGVAVRTCLSLRRSRSRRDRRVRITSEPPEPTGRTEDSKSKALEIDLLQILETLSEEDRAMMILKHAEGYNYEELAEMFDLTVSACKMRLSRAREKLKEQFPDQL